LKSLHLFRKAEPPPRSSLEMLYDDFSKFGEHEELISMLAPLNTGKRTAIQPDSPQQIFQCPIFLPRLGHKIPVHWPTYEE
jgi:hypothetical protein